ncbi:class I SAM-dependent methyltransferase [Gemmobacter sp. 24YEA27]|uniref:class I SAM-dependent methyltransferase n=1 Tax=Gemmobacter sp. 24YEA27 TaxID=3040672 RepID=UPI0024B3A6E8|nr:class I SAM-dependent methyltransferase [Gemmobacter sp. 24YEA27]
MTNAANDAPFRDPGLTRSYAETTPGRVPGFHDLHRMALILLSQSAPAEARMLILGAGGGLELLAFARARPRWSFLGLDPSEPMLTEAAALLGPLAAQVDLQQGVITDAPPGPYDGATCLLVLHFLDRSARLATLTALRQRLRPGAALIIAHHSHPEGEAEDWLTRSALFAQGDAADPAQAAASARVMAERLTLLTQAEEEALLCEAGFTAPALFYAGLSFRGWVARAPE